MSVSFWKLAGLPRLTVVLPLVLLAMTGTMLTSVAQPEAPADGVNLLRPADTSSPRDTLRSFLTLSDELIQEWRAGGSIAHMYVLLRGLGETLDFSSTAYGAASTEQIRRILMLREVLDRIELPAFGDVPGDDEIAAADIAEWTLPNTRIRIAREADGVQAGEYLFSAATVDDLDLFYRRIRQLPYKRGARGVLEDWLASGAQAAVIQRELVIRLEGIDASSPRKTLEAFMKNVNDAYRIANDAEAALTASPPEIALKEAREANRRAGSLLRRAGSTLDLSRVPQAQRDDVAVEASLMLKEVLDRLVLPPIESVPDTAEVLATDTTAGPFRWRFPGTKIEIEQVLEGERAGDFLFDKDTVAKIEDIYARLKDLPIRDEASFRSGSEYRSADTSPGFYERYISTPGNLVPSSNLIGRLVQGLPAGFQRLYSGQTVWQWISLVAVALATGALGYLAFRGTRAVGQFMHRPVNRWIAVLAPVIPALLIQVATDFVDEDLGFTGDPLMTVRTAARILVLLLYAWAVWRLFAALAATIIASLRVSSERGVDASLVRIISGLFGIVAATAVVVAGLRDLGIDALPLVAGLGIGGLAVALAIRPTLENLIGGLILFTDKPVRVGDFCRLGGMSGTIENIGVRSTQIRALDRTLISIPNAKLADMEIINYAHCDRMLITATIGLRFETTPDQMRYLLVKIREMLHAHPAIDRETVRVRYGGPAASSRDVNLRIYALTHDWNEFFAIKEDVFLRIADLVEEAGTGYAFPSQTLYMTRDQGLDEDRAGSALEQVEGWRNSGDLPFPRLRPARMDELEKTLDYPPKGSTEAIQTEALSAEKAEPLSTRELSDEEGEPKR